MLARLARQKQIIIVLVAILLVTAGAVTWSVLRAHFFEHVRVEAVTIDATLNNDGSLEYTQTMDLKVRGTLHKMDAELSQFSPFDHSEILSASITTPTGERPLENKNPSYDPNNRTVTSDPETYYYSADSHTVHVIPETSEHRVSLSFTALTHNAATVYADTAELNWQFINSSWRSDLHNITLNVRAPKPDGASTEELRVWGHGAPTGEVHKTPEGAQATVRTVPAGTFAELRMLMPTDWFSGVDQTSPARYPYSPQLDRILEVEAQNTPLGQKAFNQYRIAMAVGLLPGLVSLVFLLRCAMSIRRWPKAQFQGKYWRDNPGAALDPQWGIPRDLHPVMVEANQTFENPSGQALNAGIVRLAVRDHIAIESTDGGSLQLRRLHTGDAGNAYDQRLLELLFDVLAEGGDVLDVNDIDAALKKHRGKVEQQFDRLNTAVLDERLAFDLRTKTDFRVFQAGVVGIACAVAATALFIVRLDAVPIWLLQLNLGLSLATAALGMMAHQLQRTQRSLELQSYTDALQRWINDFTNIKDAPVDSHRVWGEFFTFAVLFNASEALKVGLHQAPLSALSATAVSSVHTWNDFDFNKVHSPLFGDSSGLFFGSTDRYISSPSASSSSSSSGFSSSGGGGGFSSGGGGGGGSTGGSSGFS